MPATICVRMAWTLSLLALLIVHQMLSALGASLFEVDAAIMWPILSEDRFWASELQTINTPDTRRRRSSCRMATGYTWLFAVCFVRQNLSSWSADRIGQHHWPCCSHTRTVNRKQSDLFPKKSFWKAAEILRWRSLRSCGGFRWKTGEIDDKRLMNRPEF